MRLKPSKLKSDWKQWRAMQRRDNPLFEPKAGFYGGIKRVLSVSRKPK